MDSITSLIKSEIKRQYGTVKGFSKASGIPYSTLSNALTKGIDGTSYATVVRICKLLKIKQTYDSSLVLFNDIFFEFYQKMAALDEQGLHTVSTVLDMEYNRCVSNGEGPIIKAFNNIGLGVREDDDMARRNSDSERR